MEAGSYVWCMASALHRGKLIHMPVVCSVSCHWKYLTVDCLAHDHPISTSFAIRKFLTPIEAKVSSDPKAWEIQSLILIHTFLL